MACETTTVTTRPRVLATLQGYAVEGGFDGPHQPATCYAPTIGLGRHSGPGRASGLWSDYERVLEHVEPLGLDGIRLTVEWARIEPRREVVDLRALDRYAEVVAHARSLHLDVTIAVVDQAWPSWLGPEAWLLPWVAPYVVAQAQRVVAHLGSAISGVVVFTEPHATVDSGFLDASSPPWRRGAHEDARSAHANLDAILATLHRDAVVGSRLVGATSTISLDSEPDELARQRANAADCQEIYVRTLVRGTGPTSASVGLLVQHGERWSRGPAAALLSVLR